MQDKKKQLEAYMDWFKPGKGVHQGCILSPCLFNLYVEYIMWNARLDESQTGIKIAGRNINNLRCADEAESENERKGLLMWIKEHSEEAGLKLNIQKTKIVGSDHISSQQLEGKKWEAWQIFSPSAPNSLQMVTATRKLKVTCSLEGKLWQI